MRGYGARSTSARPWRPGRIDRSGRRPSERNWTESWDDALELQPELIGRRPRGTATDREQEQVNSVRCPFHHHATVLRYEQGMAHNNRGTSGKTEEKSARVDPQGDPTPQQSKASPAVEEEKGP